MAGFIGVSLETLRYEFPFAYYRMCAQLAPREVLLVVEGEPVALAFDPGGVRQLPRTVRPTVQLRASRQTILDVIDARLTLNEAVLLDAIVLRGGVEDLSLFHESLLTYVQGAVRCPSFPALLDSFRRSHFIATARPIPGSSSSQ